MGSQNRGGTVDASQALLSHRHCHPGGSVGLQAAGWQDIMKRDGKAVPTGSSSQGT